MKKNSLAILGSLFGEIQHKVTPTHTLNASRTVYPSGVQILHAVIYPNTATKSERAEMLKDLIDHDLNKKDAAAALDMSASLASKLTKKK